MAASTNGTLPKNMKAVLWEGKPFHVAVREVPTAEIQQPEDAVVRVTTAAICGSDLHIYHGVLGSPTVPYSIGHESVGVVVKIGSATSTVKVGDRVIIPDLPNQGHFDPDKTLSLDELPLVFGEGSELGGLAGCQG